MAGNLEDRPDRHDAEDGGRAALVDHREGLLGRRLLADRLEAVVDAGAAARGERADSGDRILGGRVDDVGGAELLGARAWPGSRRWR